MILLILLYKLQVRPKSLTQLTLFNNHAFNTHKNKRFVLLFQHLVVPYSYIYYCLPLFTFFLLNNVFWCSSISITLDFRQNYSRFSYIFCAIWLFNHSLMYLTFDSTSDDSHSYIIRLWRQFFMNWKKIYKHIWWELDKTTLGEYDKIVRRESMTEKLFQYLRLAEFISYYYPIESFNSCGWRFTWAFFVNKNSFFYSSPLFVKAHSQNKIIFSNHQICLVLQACSQFALRRLHRVLLLVPLFCRSHLLVI